MLSALCVRLIQNKDLRKLFSFHSNNYRKINNIRTGPESANPYIGWNKTLIFQ